MFVLASGFLFSCNIFPSYFFGDHFLNVIPGQLMRRRCGLISAAVYFPGYHNDVNNDIFWGKGFTEWDHLRATSFDEVAEHALRKPKDEYTLDLQILRKHAREAKASGIGAFIFYSYWFEHGRRALEKPLLQLLPHRRLGNQFALSWANEPWTRHWNGQDGTDVLMSQTYGTSFDWSAHFKWLEPFFLHPEYLHINGRPVLFIYNMRHIADALEGGGEERECDVYSEHIYGPGGRAAAELYKKWYPDINVDLSLMHKHWKNIGRAEGRQWPLLPCTESYKSKMLRLRALRKSSTVGSTLSQMVSFLLAYAKERGFKGIYLVGTLNSYVSGHDFDALADGLFDAAAQFLPMNLMDDIAQRVSSTCGCLSKLPFTKGPEKECPPSCACVHNIVGSLARSRIGRPATTYGLSTKYFQGAFNFWSNYPRHLRDGGEAANAYCSTPDFVSFKQLLVNQFNLSLEDTCSPMDSAYPGEVSSILLLNSWNEWGEQAVMERTIQDGNAALRAHYEAVVEIERGIDRYTS